MPAYATNATASTTNPIDKYSRHLLIRFGWVKY